MMDNRITAFEWITVDSYEGIIYQPNQIQFIVITTES